MLSTYIILCKSFISAPSPKTSRRSRPDSSLLQKKEEELCIHHNSFVVWLEENNLLDKIKVVGYFPKSGCFHVQMDESSIPLVESLPYVQGILKDQPMTVV